MVDTGESFTFKRKGMRRLLRIASRWVPHRKQGTALLACWGTLVRLTVATGSTAFRVPACMPLAGGKFRMVAVDFPSLFCLSQRCSRSPNNSNLRMDRRSSAPLGTERESVGSDNRSDTGSHRSFFFAAKRRLPAWFPQGGLACSARVRFALDAEGPLRLEVDYRVFPSGTEKCCWTQSGQIPCVTWVPACSRRYSSTGDH